MGYRLSIDKPNPATYAKIFERCVAKTNATTEPGLINSILDRYTNEQRELRASEPRDLIERAREICDMRGQPFVLNRDVLNTAWKAYFGE
jgi:hypothetical protein